MPVSAMFLVGRKSNCPTNLFGYAVVRTKCDNRLAVVIFYIKDAVDRGFGGPRRRSAGRALVLPVYDVCAEAGSDS